jgi:hypothetical protein
VNSTSPRYKGRVSELGKDIENTRRDAKSSAVITAVPGDIVGPCYSSSSYIKSWTASASQRSPASPWCTISVYIIHRKWRALVTSTHPLLLRPKEGTLYLRDALKADEAEGVDSASIPRCLLHSSFHLLIKAKSSFERGRHTHQKHALTLLTLLDRSNLRLGHPPLWNSVKGSSQLMRTLSSKSSY